MEFTSSRYCKISRYLLTSVGQWPRQAPLDRAFRTFVVATFMIPSLITQIIKIFTSYQDLDMLTATISPFTTALITSIKFCTLIINKKKLENLQDEINEDWRNLKAKEEIEIMERYTEEGKFYAIAYTAYVYIGGSMFVLLIFEPPIHDFLSPLNESRPLQMLFPAEYYFFNQEEYYVPVTCHMMICGVLVLTMLTAADTMFMMYIQYICGMFAVTGHRLECTLYRNSDTEVVSSSHRRKVYNHYIVKCVRAHRKALKFVDVIESIYSLSYLIQLGLAVICMSVTLLQIVILLGKLEMMRFVVFVIGQMFHLFCTSFQGQKLIDHSLEASNHIYSGMWYITPTETQKLLLFMLKKTASPCYVTAGKFFVFSLESFSMVVQSCMSYFMMLSSFR